MTEDPIETSIMDKFPDLRDDAFVAGYDLDACYTVVAREAIGVLDLAVALLRFGGNLTSVARALRRSRRAVEGAIARDVYLTQLLTDIEAEFLDIVEELHKGAALRGDLATQRFFLTTKGKDRGYVTRNESTGKDGSPVVVHINGPDANL